MHCRTWSCTRLHGRLHRGAVASLRAGPPLPHDLPDRGFWSSIRSGSGEKGDRGSQGCGGSKLDNGILPRSLRRSGWLAGSGGPPGGLPALSAVASVAVRLLGRTDGFDADGVAGLRLGRLPVTTARTEPGAAVEVEQRVGTIPRAAAGGGGKS